MLDLTAEFQTAPVTELRRTLEFFFIAPPISYDDPVSPQLHFLMTDAPIEASSSSALWARTLAMMNKPGAQLSCRAANNRAGWVDDEPLDRWRCGCVATYDGRPCHEGASGRSVRRIVLRAGR
jgi:hypothetical protein